MLKFHKDLFRNLLRGPPTFRKFSRWRHSPKIDGVIIPRFNELVTYQKLIYDRL